MKYVTNVYMHDFLGVNS